MKSTDGNIVNPYISLMPPAKPNPVHVVEVDDVQHSLLFSLVIVRVGHLTGFNQDVVCWGLGNFKNLKGFVS